MDDRFTSNISFYLKASRIHVFIDALRGIGSPSRICFLVDETGSNLLMIPYKKRDFKSHAVPKAAYNGGDRMEINSLKLCRIIAGLHGWDLEKSYRITGTVFPEKHIAVFHLNKAIAIEKLG